METKKKIIMNRGSFPYKNSHIEYVKNLFKDVPKANGKLVHISNGGYKTWEPIAFGCRIYFDSKTGTYNCQVYSESREKRGKELLREYSVVQKDENTSLETVLNAAFYNEYISRCCLAKLEREKEE